MTINQDLVFNEVMELIQEELDNYDDLCKIACRRRGFDWGYLNDLANECKASCNSLLTLLFRFELLNADEFRAQMDTARINTNNTLEKWRNIYNGR